MDEEDFKDNIFTEENKKQRIIKYHEHGILTKTTNMKTNEQVWMFETESERKEFEAVELVTVLDDLSKEGYELICVDDGDYILRTKVETEGIEDYWDLDDLEDVDEE